MTPAKNPDLPARLLRSSIALAAAGFLLAWLFTKGLVCSIIFLSGATVSIISFMMTVKLADRFLRKGKGKFLFFAAELGKVVAIILFFVLFSPLSGRVVAAFIAGVSIVYLAAAAEGLVQLLRLIFSHGA